MMESILKTINSVKSANSLCKFLSSSAWSSLQYSENSCRKHCLMTPLLVWCASHLQGKQLPRALNNSTCTFPIHYDVRYQVVQPCTRTEYLNAYNSWLLPHIKIQSLQYHDGINMCRSVLYQTFSYARLGHVEQCNLAMLGFQVLLERCMFFSLLSHLRSPLNALHSWLVIGCCYTYFSSFSLQFISSVVFPSVSILEILKGFSKQEVLASHR